MGRAFAGLLAVVVIAATARPVAAQRPARQATLVYERTDRAQGCPGPVAIRTAVARRLGDDRLVAGARLRVVVVVDRAGDGYQASIRVTTDDGHEQGSRTLRSPQGCEALARAVVLAVTLLLGRLEAESGSPPEDVIVESPRALEEPRYPAAAVPSWAAGVLRDRTSVHRRATAAELAIGIGGQAGMLPGPGTTVGLETQLRRGGGALAAEVAWAAPTSVAVAGGSITASLVTGSLGVCGHAGRLGACLLGSLGRMSASGQGFAMDFQATAPFAAAAGRLSWEEPLTARLALRSQLHLGGTLARARLRVTGTPAGEWTAPPLSLGLGMALVARFQ